MLRCAANLVDVRSAFEGVLSFDDAAITPAFFFLFLTPPPDSSLNEE